VRLQPISQTKTSELRNDDIFPFPNSRFYCLAALALYFLGRTEAGALVGLFFFYITFEFTLVSIIPMMTELLPAARATLMAFNVAALSLGRALGDLIAPRLYIWGFWSVVLGAVVFNLLALAALRKVKTVS
jgi:predicted MFS family arabinose efflux permease